jgi:4-oxalocrotonate tautomerase
MPIIKIGIWSGRDAAVKSLLIKNVTTTVCATLGCPPAAVIVVIEEIPKENWGQAGITAAGDR